LTDSDDPDTLVALPPPVRPVALVVGLAGAMDVRLNGGPRLVAVQVGALDMALLNRLAPATIFTPLITRGADALEIAQRLVALGWRGRLVILSAGIPHPEMARREIAAACPELGVEISAKD